MRHNVPYAYTLSLHNVLRTTTTCTPTTVMYLYTRPTTTVIIIITDICENRKAQDFADSTSSKGEITYKTIFYFYFLSHERYYYAIFYWYIYSLYFMIERKLAVLVVSQVT